MNDLPLSVDMNAWLAELREQFSFEEPDLLELFDVYANEALFGRRFIAGELEGLSPTARILEIGAGSCLLSCQLVREGFAVTALEPVASGFSHFNRMQACILAFAESNGCLPDMLRCPAEMFTTRSKFDFSFSINVMEHVGDPILVLTRVLAGMAPGAHYRFTCPNYIFPYEPHFNILTFFSKSLTRRLMGRWIFSSTRIPDPTGLWDSLNWINVRQLRRWAKTSPSIAIDFNRRFLSDTLMRALDDEKFAARRSPSILHLISFLRRIGMFALLARCPADLQPAMDCVVIRDQ